MCIYNLAFYIYLSIMPKFVDDSYFTYQLRHARKTAATFRKQRKVEKRRTRKKFGFDNPISKHNRAILKNSMDRFEKLAFIRMASYYSDGEQSHSAPNNLSQTTEMDQDSFENYKKIIQQYKDEIQEDALVNKMQDFKIEDKEPVQCE